jgi:hypothetical protein
MERFVNIITLKGSEDPNHQCEFLYLDGQEAGKNAEGSQNFAEILVHWR